MSTNFAVTERPAIAPASEPSPPTAERASRILVVDDNRDILRATQRILTAHKYDVLTAMDGEEAVDTARRERPDLILLDVMIPKIDGLEVCRRLKNDAETSGIMIIHVTGRGSVDNRVQGFNAGADDYIPKPFHLPELLARIRSALRIKHLTDDLAERNRQLLKSQKDLVQSEKMATIGLLAAGIAHEFNNIMAGISGYAQLAKKHPKYKDTLVEVALTQTDRALELTRSLSTYNKPAQGEPECEASRIIENALCLVAKDLETSGVRVEKEFTGRPHVKMSAGQFQEVILNLVLNSIQAIERPDGRIAIRVGPGAQGNDVLIEVSDNGHGIPEASLGRIFDPFFTTKGALGGGRQSGTGLGLTVVYNYIKSSGGSIEVTSRVGQGTTFRITLPRASTAEAGTGAAAAAAAGQPASAAPGAPLRILIVDDEKPVRDLLREFLEGHDVLCCATGEAALEAFEKQRFDFVILDLCIRHSMNGFQVFDRLMSSGRPPKVIFSSGRFPDPACQKYLERAHGHLLKPFKFESLAALLGLEPAGGGPVTK